MSQSPPSRSPWALQNVRTASVIPATYPVHVTMRVPGSKSYTNRALLMAAMAHGESVLQGLLRSDDSYFCVEALRQLGIAMEVQDDVATVHGCAGQWPRSVERLFIGSAGTTARFLPGLLAASQGGPWGVDGSPQLQGRPLRPLLQALSQLGAQFTYPRADGALPVKIAGRGLGGGTVKMSGQASSQFISGVLLASPYAREPVTLEIADDIVQHAYVMMTLDMMAAFGVSVAHDPGLRRFHVTPQHYVGRLLQVEADASTAGYFFALAALTGGQVHITNLGESTRQPDIKLVDVLARMGCRVTRRSHTMTVHGASVLRGGFTQSMKEMSDQTLTLAALAPFADAPITLTEVAHIRHHESDRIASICHNLRLLGINVDEHDDGLTVHPGTPHGAIVPSFDDHRIAMSMALIGVRCPEVVIEDPGCVSKTCPTFFTELQRAGVQSVLTPA